jgi:hypothetical protein
MLRIRARILHPEIGRKVDYEAGSRIEDVPGYPGRLPVLQAQKDHILAARSFTRRAAAKPGVSQRSEGRVNRSHRLPCLAPAGHHAFGHIWMLQQQTQKLTGDIAGASNDGDFHL